MKKEELWKLVRKERREAAIKSLIVAITLAILIAIGTENIYFGIVSAVILFLIFWGLGVITSLLTLLLHQMEET